MVQNDDNEYNSETACNSEHNCEKSLHDGYSLVVRARVADLWPLGDLAHTFFRVFAKGFDDRPDGLARADFEMVLQPLPVICVHVDVFADELVVGAPANSGDVGGRGHGTGSQDIV